MHNKNALLKNNKVVYHSARIVHGTSYSDVTSRERPNLGPYVNFLDTCLRPSVRRTSFVRSIRTPRRCDVFSTSATSKDVPKTYVCAQIRSSSRRPLTSCRGGCGAKSFKLSLAIWSLLWLWKFRGLRQAKGRFFFWPEFHLRCMS